MAKRKTQAQKAASVIQAAAFLAALGIIALKIKDEAEGRVLDPRLDLKRLLQGRQLRAAKAEETEEKTTEEETSSQKTS